ncbi:MULTISPECIES: shikimate dehydrogenase [Weeksella]|uniref:shikimate dehydrogenase family protein n=1 Tax=Weeksella TaxID=1013 RepID=UPI0008A60946|nr:MULTISPECIES: shikimate dehydrogenase [Weeksella]MDK7375728.1 shikimate dehydrogenase [Weeksella virosa]OFM84173.1 shikimate dehydrogenase [Weeksella sp. HMSC059D05]
MYTLGLIGKNISYSFSVKYFTEKFEQLNLGNYSYELFDLKNINEIETLFRNKNLLGFNITIPYKQAIIPYLDELSPEAKEVGAVNTVKIDNGKKIGYNTDVYGFEKSFVPMLSKHHQKALILGNGGASKAVVFVVNKLGIPYTIVSRNDKKLLHYDALDEDILASHQIIINCTPVGTYPQINATPKLPYQFLTDIHYLYDLIYNPEETIFLQLGKKKGAKTKNGLEMLHLQAEKSWEIWVGL